MKDALSIRTLVPAVGQKELVRRKLQNTTFVGIDFGTSTTVASYATLGHEGRPVLSEPIPIPQQLPDGRAREYHLVPSVIAWHNERLFIGAGAAELKNRLAQGRNVWSSFKMELGVDLGPRYYNTSLPQGHEVATIETPRDAATIFFAYLRQHIEAFVEAQGLPQDIEYCVSTPASFEANQRRDLLSALQAAGIALPVQGFIDEPNAAFLSYLAEANMNRLGRLHVPKEQALHLLVFDFGAGTCDISILEIGQGVQAFYSKNLAISRFEALGGDDIDRAIAQNVLLPALLEQNGVRDKDLRTAELTKYIIPKLLRTAEILKIRTCTAVASQMIGTTLPSRANSAEVLVLDDLITITTPKRELTFEKPSLSPSQLAEVMEPFLERDERKRRLRKAEEPISIFEPVESALRKADLQADELDMVLLIGGSAQSPYVQAALHQFSEAEVEVPTDLRAHVSTGAALNSLLLNGLDTNVIRPITSEPILVVTKDEGLHTLIRAGTPIPCGPVTVSDLRVGSSGQSAIEIPICVTSENKILSVIEIESNRPTGFEKGTSVELRCEISSDKLLKVQAVIDGEEERTETLHPFSNRELTTTERAILQAEKVANSVAARNNGRPTVASLKQLKEAYIEAGEYLQAAELTETIAMLDVGQSYDTSLCYLYSKAGNLERSRKWAEIAYENEKSAVTSFNLALDRKSEGKTSSYEKLMEESLKHNSDSFSALAHYGRHLMQHGEEDRGRDMVERAFEAYYARFKRQCLDENDYSRLIGAARTLERYEVVQEAEQSLKKFGEDGGAFNREHLLSRHEDALAKTT